MRSALKTFYSASKAPENGVKYLLWKIGIKKNKKKKKPWKERYGWFRTALPWSKAVNRCGGYDSDLILEKCRQSLLQVKQGNAVYERDSVLFDHIEYSWPVLAGLMTAAAHAGGRLHVLDIGGSLGSTYFQNGRFLKCLKDVVWHIVEQPQFVACGKADFTNEQLKFHEEIDDIIAFNNINVILVSSMLQYVENPYDLLSDIVKKQVPFLIFDRTTFSSDAENFLAIQKVNPSIYSASYPCWFLDRGKFFQSVQNDYELVEQFYSLNHPIKLQDGKKVIECPEEGFIFMRKEISHG
jgi:putative methyltransferase (TIGR04325 family)